METSERGETLDPLGLELALAIASTTLTTISLLIQFGVFLRRRREGLDPVRRLRKQVLNLHNAVDDLVLALTRYSHETAALDLSNAKLSIADTMLELKQRDYRRWLDIHDRIKRIDQEIYAIVGEVRDIADPEPDFEALDPELIRSFDRLMLGTGGSSFDRFILDLREIIELLGGAVDGLATAEERRPTRR